MSVSLFLFHRPVHLCHISDYTYEWCMVFVWVTSLSMVISSCIHVAASGIISFFLWLSSSPLHICIDGALLRHKICQLMPFNLSIFPFVTCAFSVISKNEELSLSPPFPGGSDNKESSCDMGDPSSILGLRRSPGGWNGTPLQYSAWRIPWTEEPNRLQSMGLQRIRHDWATNTWNTFPKIPHLVYQKALLATLQNLSWIQPVFVISTTAVQDTIISQLDHSCSWPNCLPASTLSFTV